MTIPIIGQNKDHLGKQPTQREMFEREVITQLGALNRNIANLRQTLLSVARVAGVEAKTLVRAMQEIEATEEYVKKLGEEELLVQAELNKKNDKVKEDNGVPIKPA